MASPEMKVGLESKQVAGAVLPDCATGDCSHATIDGLTSPEIVDSLNEDNGTVIFTETEALYTLVPANQAVPMVIYSKV